MEETLHHFDLQNMDIETKLFYEDFLFKKVMKDTLILEAFLKEVLGNECVGTINPNIIEDYKLHEVKEGHYITCDLLVRDDRNSIFIIENQNYQVPGFINRMEFQSQLSSIQEYTTKNYPNSSYDYAHFPKIYCIWIWNKNPFDSNEGMIEFTKQSRQTNESFYPIQRQVILSRNCADTIKNTRIRDFLRFIDRPCEEIALHSNWRMLRLLYERYLYLSGTNERSDELMIGYDDMMHYQSVGEARGLKKGIEQNKEEVVKNLAKKKQTSDFIAEVVGMTKSEVEAILKKPVQA